VAFGLIRGSLEAIRVRQTAGWLLTVVQSGNDFAVNKPMLRALRWTATVPDGEEQEPFSFLSHHRTDSVVQQSDDGIFSSGLTSGNILKLRTEQTSNSILKSCFEWEEKERLSLMTF